MLQLLLNMRNQPKLPFNQLNLNRSDSVVSFLAGLGVFAALGYLKHTTNQSFDRIVKEGAALAIAVYSDALSRWGGPNFWCALFFVTLMMLGMSSQMGFVHVVSSAILDEWPALLKYRVYVNMVLCTTMFLVAVPTMTKGGVTVVDFLDHFVAKFSYFAIGALQLLVVSYIYGTSNFIDDLKSMIGDLKWKGFLKKFAPAIGPYSWYFRISWMIATPTLCIALLAADSIDLYLHIYTVDPMTGQSQMDMDFPGKIWIFGIFLAILPIIICILFEIVVLVDVKFIQKRKHPNDELDVSELQALGDAQAELADSLENVKSELRFVHRDVKHNDLRITNVNKDHPETGERHPVNVLRDIMQFGMKVDLNTAMEMTAPGRLVYARWENSRRKEMGGGANSSALKHTLMVRFASDMDTKFILDNKKKMGTYCLDGCAHPTVSRALAEKKKVSWKGPEIKLRGNRISYQNSVKTWQEWIQVEQLVPDAQRMGPGWKQPVFGESSGAGAASSFSSAVRRPRKE